MSQNDSTPNQPSLDTVLMVKMQLSRAAVAAVYDRRNKTSHDASLQCLAFSNGFRSLRFKEPAFIDGSCQPSAKSDLPTEARGEGEPVHRSPGRRWIPFPSNST